VPLDEHLAGRRQNVIAGSPPGSLSTGSASRRAYFLKASLTFSPAFFRSPLASSYPTWLYRIVTRRALNRITRTRIADSLDLLADVSGSGDEPAQDVERDLEWR
jgi:hypothetical protein